MKNLTMGNFRHRRTTFVALFLFMWTVSTVTTASAQKAGALIVNPKRVVFEGGDRNETLTLINSGADSATFQLTPAQMKMDDDGNLTEVDSIANPSSPLLRYFPKQVTLAPNQSQTVRVQLLKPSSLPAGEYRSYIKFVPVKRARAITEVPDTSKKLHLSVATVFSVAVPVIVRNNTSPAVASIGGLKMGWDTVMRMPSVSGTLYRSGSQSIYGMFVARFVPNSGKERMLCTAKGIAVYVPNGIRKFVLPLDVPKGMTLSKGKLIVEYQTYSPEATKESIQASSQLILN